MFLWVYPLSAKTETKDTYKIPCWHSTHYANRGHFILGKGGNGVRSPQQKHQLPGEQSPKHRDQDADDPACKKRRES